MSILTPSMIGIDGFSTVALAQGEWLYNFGFFGLVFMLPVVGFGIRALDAWLTTASLRRVQTNRQLLSLCAAICLAGGMADLAWGGSTPSGARTLPRLVVIGGVYVLMSTFSKGRASSPAASARWKRREMTS